MYHWLTSATKKRLIQEIKQILYDHPRYREDHQNVHNKYTFEQRQKRGVMINGTSADRIKLSADNFMGVVSSFCMLSPVDGKPSTSIEWVRENYVLLEKYSKTRTVFPSEPGTYTINILCLPDVANGIPGKFEIQPTITVDNEMVLRFEKCDHNTAHLSHTNIYPGSVRLYVNNSVPLINGTDYSINDKTGVITFNRCTPINDILYADYRFISEKIGPIQFNYNEYNDRAIPGVVIAFGDRAFDGDSQVIVITNTRSDTMNVYGGKFEVRFDVVLYTSDSEDRELMSDYIVHKFLDIQSRLGDEGIDITDITPSGENEEIKNDVSDEYYYESSISISLKVDWETHVPLPVVTYRVDPISSEEEKRNGFLDGSITYDMLIATDKIKSSVIETIIGSNYITYEKIT